VSGSALKTAASARAASAGALKRAASGAAVVALALAATGCATLSGAGQPPSSEPDVADQLFKLQKDTAAILDRTAALEQKLSGGQNTACAEAAARSENIERQVRVLEEQFLATQQRLDAIASELRNQRHTGAAPPRADEPGKAPPAAAAGSPEDLFNGAYADYSRGNYDLALSGFESTLRADPQGPLADDAQYWIGETLYAKSQYADAAAAFDKVIAGWPNGDKLAVAHLKRGLSLYEARRTAEGVAELQRVIQTWPGSDEARLARDFLKRKGAM
jgi:tol-pal system protein YbgF